MSKPNYRVHLTWDPDRKVFLARCPELEHCTAEGASRAEAIGRIEEEIDAQLANMLSHGGTPPRSVDEEEFSGEISVKLSKTLHRDLAFQSRSEGVELDQLTGELLSAAMVERKQNRQRGGNRQPHPQHGGDDSIGNRHDGNRGGGGGGRGFGRGHNPQMLDDRAHFIEYVRGLEQGQQQGGGGGRPHNNGPYQGGGRRRRGGRGGGGGGAGGVRYDNRPNPSNGSAAPPSNGNPSDKKPGDSDGNG
jgi:predicted RNase H-like HicB family nuclease